MKTSTYSGERSKMSFAMIVLLLACGTIESQQLTTENQDHQYIETHIHLGDPKNGLLFFTIKDMKVGTTMSLKFQINGPPNSYFLSKEQADSIPFSLEQLHEILQIFSLLPKSQQAKDVKHLLRLCESPPIEGETKYCTTSLETLVDHTQSFFGIDRDDIGHLSLLRSTFLDGPRVAFQNYTILKDPEELRVTSMVGCHVMPYPYAVYYCHHQGGRDRVFRVLLRGENEDKVDAVVACHEIISKWDPNLAVFHKVRTPSETPLCHFFPPVGNLVWVYNDNSSQDALF